MNVLKISSFYFILYYFKTNIEHNCFYNSLSYLTSNIETDMENSSCDRKSFCLTNFVHLYRHHSFTDCLFFLLLFYFFQFYFTFFYFIVIFTMWKLNHHFHHLASICVQFTLFCYNLIFILRQ